MNTACSRNIERMSKIMYEKKLNGELVKIDEPMVAIPVRKLENLLRIAERVEAVKRTYYENKGILCTSDVVAILDIAKTEEENENA